MTPFGKLYWVMSHIFTMISRLSVMTEKCKNEINLSSRISALFSNLTIFERVWGIRLSLKIRHTQKVCNIIWNYEKFCLIVLTDFAILYQKLVCEFFFRLTYYSIYQNKKWASNIYLQCNASLALNLVNRIEKN